MPTEDEMREIKARAAERFLTIPGVVAVGLGSKETGGEPTGELVIKVFVRVKRPPEEVPADELIPSEFEGVRTDVVVGGERVPLVDPPGGLPDGEYNVRHRPLVGGCRMVPVDSEWRGTLGCIVTHTTDATKVYALTNQHVIDVPDRPTPVVGSSEIGQPDGDSSCSDCCDDRIGKYAGGARTDERDEALVQLAAGMTWLAEILEIGVVAGKHSVTQAEAATGTYKVRKRGMRTRLTGGVISALDATTSTADNLIIIRPNPNPDAGARTVFFAYEGDSGSALVNESNEVVGLIDSRDDAGNGYAYAIQPVLDRLAAVEHVPVDVATATSAGTLHTVPGAAMVAVPPEVVATVHGQPDRTPEPVVAAVPGWLLPVPPPASGALSHVQTDLDRSPTGRRLITFWLRHQDELRGLVTGNRRVATVWHRSGASALFQLGSRMAVDPTVKAPETINGQPLAAVLDRIHDLFRRIASPQLCDDLDDLRWRLPSFAGLTYAQVIDALAVQGVVDA